MGNLVIKQVRYRGDNYVFDSPPLEYGLNIIVGDNGSGKSTLVYFIEFGLGGNIPFFSNENEKEKYKEITNDTNNFVEIDILIDDNPFTLKRFVDQKEILINDGKNVKILPLNRRKDSAPNIFSDWILQKLKIPTFELNLGSQSWKFNFNDLLRLLIYDQDTDIKKIYKSPSNENFITDSLIIRKSIFETLLGMTSIEFFTKHDELKQQQRVKNLASAKLEDFQLLNGSIPETKLEVKSKIEYLDKHFNDLLKERDLYQSQNTKVDDKTNHLGEIQSEFTNLDLDVSALTVKKKNHEIEFNKIDTLYSNLENEISEIRKIIFTNDKLNLFSMEFCPFCMSEKRAKPKHCICGEPHNTEEYEKFVYNSSEYKTILQHKKKGLQTIGKALVAYEGEIDNISKELDSKLVRSVEMKQKLRDIIRSIEFSGNSQLIDSFNDQILETRTEILNHQALEKKIHQQSILQEELEFENSKYKSLLSEYNVLKKSFEKDNKSRIVVFNKIYGELMSQSSRLTETAEIDDDYMPIIDGGNYLNRSSNVPRRLMYFYTILCLALKTQRVKHPKILIIDTPDTFGIDDDNMKKDLSLLNVAIDLVEKPIEELKYQVILTTGLDMFPSKFKDSIRLEFNASKGNYILNKREVEDKFQNQKLST